MTAVDITWTGLTPQLTVLYDVINRRRDVRAEYAGFPPEPSQLQRVLQAAHAAPSVGNTQPWDFVVIENPTRLQAFAEHVATCRQAFADSLPPERREVFNPIKVEGIVESGTGIVVTYDPERGGTHILGRATVDDVGVFSAVLAIQNLWLAATAEGLGVGWVSFYDESFLRDFVGIEDGSPVRPIAWLCIGQVTGLQEVPDLVRFGWRARRPLAEAVHHDRLGFTECQDGQAG